MVVDDPAFAIGTVIKLPHSMLAEERQIVHDLFEILLRPVLLPLAEIGPARHSRSLPVSLFIRHQGTRVRCDANRPRVHRILSLPLGSFHSCQG